VVGVSWRLEIDHTTRFRYSGPVAASYNEARLSPQTTPGQFSIDARLELDLPAHVTRYWDYWGTLVHAFEVQVPHTELMVRARSVVETAVGLVPDGPGYADTTWEALDDAAVSDMWCEFLMPSRYVPADAVLAKAGTTIRADASSPDQAVDVAAQWVRDRLSYEPGATTVSTSAVEALARGKGVCQDFVHLALGVLRAASIPARYVSGYLHPHADAPLGGTARGESHAWLEAFVGEWRPVDPTNGSPVAARHVSVARGRDYGDVSPLKGIYAGGPAAESAVTVDLTRLA
jgi:transglutaminase-like putative cysteine protease